MPKQSQSWSKPELVRLGRLPDVAPSIPGGGQGVNNLS